MWQPLLSLRGPTHQGENFPPNRVRAPPLLASQPRALRESRRSHTASSQSLAPDPYPAHVACPGTACCATPPSPESRLPVACCVAKAASSVGRWCRGTPPPPLGPSMPGQKSTIWRPLQDLLPSPHPGPHLPCSASTLAAVVMLMPLACQQSPYRLSPSPTVRALFKHPPSDILSPLPTIFRHR
jgi:hypothetical protein